MPEHKLENHELGRHSDRSQSRDPDAWQVPVAVDDIAETGQHFDLVADAHTRAGVARVAGLRDLPRLTASFDVIPHGAGGLRIVGYVSATVGQNCVVTLEPLDSEIAEGIELLFLPQAAAPGAPRESERDDEPREVKGNEPEPLVGGRIDLGAIATEFLVLGIDPYPRKEGAVFQPPQQLSGEDGPFAALEGLKKGHSGR